MNLSTILVISKKESLHEVIDCLNKQTGVDVHHSDPDTGRMIITQEAETIDDEVAGLKRLKKLPNIIYAEMVSHYFGEDKKNYAAVSQQDLDALDNGTSGPVPEYLND
ncbi:MAG: chaperone NapD [gamma proteobacterium symbiont of Bathyaustriella thionipta]|nr:chaperone NapD [gamma proteobacterium symbiont of Bathyaustriella thionipta]